VASTSRPATIAADDAVIQADHALVQALEKGDKAAANNLLDPDFSWIDSEGAMWVKEDAFQAGLKPLSRHGQRRPDHRAQVQGGLDSDQPGQADPSLNEYLKALPGDPVANRKLYDADSPITYIRSEKAPLLVLQGDNDPRVVIMRFERWNNWL
jgi:fermentation-respiration switch protein FrsA (DUF1100 family)